MSGLNWRVLSTFSVGSYVTLQSFLSFRGYQNPTRQINCKRQLQIYCIFYCKNSCNFTRLKIHFNTSTFHWVKRWITSLVKHNWVCLVGKKEKKRVAEWLEDILVKEGFGWACDLHGWYHSGERNVCQTGWKNKI